MSPKSTTTRPLRVLHILDTLGGGGTERLVWDIVRLSEQSRVRHRVVTIFRDGYLAEPVYAEPLQRAGAYRVRQREVSSRRSKENEFKIAPEPLRRRGKNLPPGLKRPLVGIWNFAFSIWQSIKSISEHIPAILKIPGEYFRFRPDVVHTHGFYGFKYGLMFKTAFRRPMVHTVPALFSQMEAQGTGWMVSRYRRFHRYVDRFALDAGYRSELRSIGVPDEKLVDIKGTLDLDAIALANAQRERHRLDVRRRFQIPDDAVIALSVGRLDPTKGHLHALEALPSMLKHFPNLHWILLGEGSQRAGLEQRSKELGVEAHTHLAGFDPEPLRYYAAADVYLRTTTMEGENISSRQAIAIGLPTVGFETGCKTDLIAKLGHGILVANADAEALGEAACRLLSMPNHGAAVGSRGVDYCKANLGIQKHVDDLLVLYSELQRRKDSSGFIINSSSIREIL